LVCKQKTMPKKIWFYWLQHFALLWLLINIFNAVDYAYKVSIWGPLTVNADLTPITVWQMFVIHNFHRPDFLYLAAVTFMIEFNYRYIFKRYHFAFFAAGAIVISGLSTSILIYSNTGNYPSNLVEPMVGISGYALFYVLIREFFYQRLYKLKVRADVSETQLNNLKQQLNPHFLFNTLNYLYGTALHENAHITAAAIDMMAAMMRYTVTGAQETFVYLNDELVFIQNYLQLQKQRVATDMQQQISIDINVPESGLKIAPLLLLPFVENAFKFGISTDYPALINISIKLHAADLTANITNAIIPGREKAKGTGNGIILSKQRLTLLYPRKHKLNIAATDTEYSVSLILNLN